MQHNTGARRIVHQDSDRFHHFIHLVLAYIHNEELSISLGSTTVKLDIQRGDVGMGEVLGRGVVRNHDQSKFSGAHCSWKNGYTDAGVV